MMAVSAPVYPVILAGGLGTRLWPLSRESYPKHLLKLLGERTLLQDTVLRAMETCGHAPILITNEQHRFIVATQLQEIDSGHCRIVLEPSGRNTAPAASVAALMVAQMDPDGLVLLLPSDHHIGDITQFANAVDAARRAAAHGRIVTFGITPTAPETGYGYIETGEALPEADGCHAVARFVEKPDLDTAMKLLAQGHYLWNGGMFLFPPAVLLEEMQAFEPGVVGAARDALSGAQPDLDFLRLARIPYEASPSISIDHAVMERTARAAVCRLSAAWADLGSWQSIWENSRADDDGNVLRGDVVAADVQGSLVRSDNMLTAVVGLRDVVVVATSDAVLVAHKDRTQDVRKVVDLLKARSRRELRENRVTERPWGSFQRIDTGERYQVKQIMLKPGASISLQLHRFRAEHWVVVEGSARVTLGDRVFSLRENESTYVPPGTRHRLENPGNMTLRLIEVQTGGYLGEDDIVRFDDVYGRVPAE